MRYPASEKLEIIKLVEQSHLPARRTLEQLGIPRRTFCRWYDRYLDGGPEALEDRPSAPSRVWNRIPAEVHDQIIELALDESELSPRELAVRFTDARKDQTADHRTSALAAPQTRRLTSTPRRGQYSANLRHAKALTGNPYDGHTLRATIEHTQRLTRREIISAPMSTRDTADTMRPSPSRRAQLPPRRNRCWPRPGSP